MKDGEAGQIATQLSESMHIPVAWVKYSGAESSHSYFAQASYNASAIAVAAALGDRGRRAQSAPVSAHLIWALIVFALLIFIVMQNKRIYQSGASFAPARK